MATQDWITRDGTLKLPEFPTLVDSLTFAVASGVSNATIVAGSFTLTTSATIDASGDDGWPSTGHFCIAGVVYTYTGISGATFTGCDAAFGDQSVPTGGIVANEIGGQYLPASVINTLIGTAKPFLVYRGSAQTGLNWTIAPGVLRDDNARYTYAGATQALTDSATNYVELYLTGGAATIAVNTSAFTSGRIPLAKVTLSSGAVTAYEDCRADLALDQTGSGGTPTSIADADADTKVQVEESADEDTIRFDAAGTEVATMAAGAVVINPGGADIDFTVEGDTDPDLLFVNAGTDRVGISTTSPSNTLHVAGSFGLAVVSSTSGTINASDTNCILLADATSGAITVNLPQASTAAGRMYVIMKIDSSMNAVTIDGYSSETINGATTATLPIQWFCALLFCTGTGWINLIR